MAHQGRAPGIRQALRFDGGEDAIEVDRHRLAIGRTVRRYRQTWGQDRITCRNKGHGADVGAIRSGAHPGWRRSENRAGIHQNNKRRGETGCRSRGLQEPARGRRSGRARRDHLGDLAPVSCAKAVIYRGKGYRPVPHPSDDVRGSITVPTRPDLDTARRGGNSPIPRLKTDRPTESADEASPCVKHRPFAQSPGIRVDRRADRGVRVPVRPQEAARYRSFASQAGQTGRADDPSLPVAFDQGLSTLEHRPFQSIPRPTPHAFAGRGSNLGPEPIPDVGGPGDRKPLIRSIDPGSGTPELDGARPVRAKLEELPGLERRTRSPTEYHQTVRVRRPRQEMAGQIQIPRRFVRPPLIRMEDHQMPSVDRFSHDRALV